MLVYRDIRDPFRKRDRILKFLSVYLVFTDVGPKDNFRSRICWWTVADGGGGGWRLGRPRQMAAALEIGHLRCCCCHLARTRKFVRQISILNARSCLID